MSLQETIAVLTGKLVFDIDGGPLRRFTQMLASSQKQMAAMAKQADTLSSRLNKAFGVKQNSAQRTKLDADLRRSLDKELSAELKLSRLRRSQFATKLAEQKLTSAGTREQAFIQGSALKGQIASSVLAAKQYRAQQESLKIDLGKQKLQAGLEQSKLREARLADVLQRRQERTLQLQQQQALQQNKFQRAELALVAAKERGTRLAERYQASKLNTAAREARATVRAEQTAGRYVMATERHQAWKARQEEPQGLGLGGFAVAVSAAGAALYSLTAAFGYASERVAKRQEDASASEQFNTALESSTGKNPANQKFARDRYLDISNKYGIELSVDSSKAYAQFIQGQMALGKTLTQATNIFESQSATFRAAALDKEAQKRAAYQLNQIRAKGKPEGSDVNDLFDAVGGPVASSIRAAAAERIGFKGKVDEQAGWFKAQVTAGAILARDFDTGMQNFLAKNQDILAKQMNSIAAAQQRSENQSFVSDNAINSGAELKTVILERVEAERQLNAALQPFKESLAAFDLGLTKLATTMLRMTAGRNADGSEKTAEDRAREIGNAGVDGAISLPVKPGTLTTQQRLDEDARNPMSKIWRSLFGGTDLQAKADDNRERWGKVGFDEVNAPWSPVPPALDLSRLNTGGLTNYGKRLEDLLSQSNPNAAVAKFATAAAANASRAAPGSRGEWVSDERAVKAEPVVNNITNNTPVTVEVNITAKTDASAAEIGSAVSGQVREEMQKVFQSYQPKEVL